jgi:glycine oxidase
MRTLIIGGGIIGCATALELAKAGCAVTVVERATPGAEASGAAAGLLAPLGGFSETAFGHLAIESWRRYPAVVRELRDRTGIDVEHVTRGTIYPLASAEDVRGAEARLQSAWAHEVGVEAWDAGDVRRREPALAPGVRGAMFIRGDHWVNNERLVVAYAQAAAAAGARLVTGATVSRVVVEGGRARGAIVEGEPYEADAVLLAAGAWTGALAESFGSRLRIEPRKGQMLALTHVPPVLTYAIHGPDVYLVPRASGELLIGATLEKVGFQRSVTASAVASLLNAAIALVPGLANLPITRTWCGFRPWAPDSLPVLGPWPGIDGLFVATAHYRNGILLAPITAHLMAEWMTHGHPSLDVKDFLPNRFIQARLRRDKDSRP